MSTTTTHIKTEKQLVPALRFKEFEDGWTKKDFGTIVEKAKAKHDPQKSKEEYPCIEMESIAKESSILLEVFNSKDQLSIKNKFSKGEVLFGKLRPNLKKYVIAPFDGVCSSEIWVLKGKELSNEFLFRLIQTNKFYSSTLVTSGSKMPRADWAYISSSIFPFPSLPEQQKIASFLSEVDEKIQQLSKKKALLEQYKKGVMQQLFSGQLRFKDEDGNSYPEWEEKRLGEIFEDRNEKGFNDMELLSISIKRGVYSQSESNKIDNSNSDKSKYKRILIGDIGYNSMRMWQGASAVSSLEGIISPAYTVLKRNENNNSEYFGFLFKMSGMIQTFQKHSQGLTSDTWNLKYPMISKIKVMRPSLEEQQKIASYLSGIDTKIAAVNTQITQTQTFKKGLLQQMFV